MAKKKNRHMGIILLIILAMLVLLGLAVHMFLQETAQKSLPPIQRRAVYQQPADIHNFMGSWGYMHDPSYMEKAARYAKAVGFDYIYMNEYAHRYGLLNVPYLTSQDWYPDEVPWRGIMQNFSYEKLGCYRDGKEVYAWSSHRMIDLEQQDSIMAFTDYFRQYFSGWKDYDAIFIDGVSNADAYMDPGLFAECRDSGGCCDARSMHSFTFWQGKAELILRLTDWAHREGKPVIWNIWGQNEFEKNPSFITYLFNYTRARPDSYIVEGGMQRLRLSKGYTPNQYTQAVIWKENQDVPFRISDQDALDAASMLAQNGLWFGYYANMEDLQQLSVLHKLARVIPNWENLNRVPLEERKKSMAGYYSPYSTIGSGYVWSTNPKSGKIFIVFRQPGVPVRIVGSIKAVYTANDLWEQDRDITYSLGSNGLYYSQGVLIADSAGTGRGYIIELA